MKTRYWQGLDESGPKRMIINGLSQWQGKRREVGWMGQFLDLPCLALMLEKRTSQTPNKAARAALFANMSRRHRLNLSCNAVARLPWRGSRWCGTARVLPARVLDAQSRCWLSFLYEHVRVGHVDPKQRLPRQRLLAGDADADAHEEWNGLARTGRIVDLCDVCRLGRVPVASPNLAADPGLRTRNV